MKYLLLLTLLALVALAGCMSPAKIAETVEAAESQVIVETGRTEAQTTAQITKMNAVVELGCYVGAGVCVFLAMLGIYLKSKTLFLLSLFGIIAFSIEATLLVAKVTHSKLFAFVGAVLLLVAAGSFIVVVILNRKALVQSVIGNENYKKRLIGKDEIFKAEQRKVQSKASEKIIDVIRNGDSK